MNGVRLLGCGHHTPDRVVPNGELEAALGLDPGWIERRTGIAARRWAGPEDTLCGLATPAARMALAQAGLPIAAINYLLLATSTPDRKLPPTAPALAENLGLRACGTIDLAGACTGFLHALILGESFVRMHRRPVLVVAANILSRRIDPADRASAILFADAAGAVVIGPDDDPARGICGLNLATDGSRHDLVEIAPGDARMRIRDGGTLFVEATRLMTECSRAALAQAGLQAAAIDRFIPHQANARIFDRVAGNLGVPPDRVARSLDRFGNSSAATIPLTLSLAQQTAPLMPGEMLLLAAAGAGLLGGAIVWRV